MGWTMSPAELNLARRLRLGEDSPLELKRILLSGSRVTSPNRNEFADELASLPTAGVEPSSSEWTTRPARSWASL